MIRERGDTVIIRAFTAQDGPETARLFRETIVRVNLPDYGREAALAWAAGAEDTAAWTASFAGHTALVAEVDGQLAGFGDMRPDGYLDRLFVHARCQGQGIGSALLRPLEESAPVSMLRTEVSLTARPFFEARGWQVVRRQEVVRRGLLLVNFVMEKKRGSQ